MSTLFKNLLIALAIAGVLGAVYFFLSSGDDVTAPSDLPADPDIAVKIERILIDTQRIDDYEIAKKSAILSELKFQSLVDRRVQVPDVATGRENPFAPVE